MGEIDHDDQRNDINSGARFAKWMSWLFLMLSALSLIFTYYRAEIIYLGTLDDRYFK